ncbi:hypothetical protein [Phenylobacterium sp.]|uniref:hypothetical protein n=1 Tax=Phenylobacterium sp. TaxID=1871053 RepID=UPI0035B0AD98
MDADHVERLIAEAYNARGDGLGWRLLGGRWATLKTADVAFLTLNPGGAAAEPDRLSCEEGSIYVVERWPGYDDELAPLQRQVQCLFRMIGVAPDEVLAGYMVPFRSRSWRSLRDRAGAVAFGRDLWSELLASRRPRLVVTISGVVFEAMRDMLDGGDVRSLNSGWGSARIRMCDYHGGRLVGLPHLSRYRLFSRPACRDVLAGVLAP